MNLCGTIYTPAGGSGDEARHPLQLVLLEHGGRQAVDGGRGDRYLHHLSGQEPGSVGNEKTADPLSAERAHSQWFRVI